MPKTEEYQGSSVPFSFLGRSIHSIRRNQVVSMEAPQEEELEDHELFQKHVADRFTDLSDGVDNLLSIAWLRKLLDNFLCCESEFKALLFLRRDPSHIAKPPLDRLIPELFDRAVKALDICNAITNGVDAIRHCQKLAEIAVFAIRQKPLGEAQVRRATKALNSLVSSMMIEDKDSNTNRELNWSSFGLKGGGSAPIKHRSWSVSRTWSAAKQIQAMSSNLVAPRGGEMSGLASLVYVMSTVSVFVMSALVAAIPCQERGGLVTHFPVPRQLVWARPVIGLQERITEEWKKKEKRGSAGLLEELQRLESCGQAVIELVDSFQFPLTADRVEEIGVHVAELAETCRKMEEGLVPLQCQIREVFHRIVRTRTEVIDFLDQASKLST
ncbi:hypothetical protein HHK36_001200 [Tetracentron sinense]|uniref:Protein BYPASS-related n=1 Tax=Tetracentron sinense TaxID=13715 RepID=A0A835DUJ7_TETSI|nr:hypothetical protein HHK36_001200 [Tetracentron sinense]